MPSRSVVAVLDAPSAGSRTTVALATAALEGSVTWPCKLPPGSCAGTPKTKMSSAANSSIDFFALRLNETFIPSPKVKLAIPFFRLISGKFSAPQAPWRKDHVLATFGRGAKNGFDAAEKRDDCQRNFAIALRGDFHDRIP